jgi:alpha-1,2-mannosyltransferase
MDDPRRRDLDQVEGPQDDPQKSPGAGKRRTLEFSLLAAIAIAIPLAWWIGWTIRSGGSSFNDFHDFWLAGKLITMGQSPYDKHALVALSNAQGLHFLVGTGYSYPLPFAIAMIPFSYLPFNTALLVFNGLGLAVFGLMVAWWIGWAHGWEPGLTRRRILLAAAAGLYPSVYGTLANGQACLVLMPLLGLGCIGILDGKKAGRFVGGVALGLAAIVKLTPGVMVVPLLLGRHVRAGLGVIAGALGALAVATIAVPWAGEGSGGLAALFEPDSYFTNQSLNGTITRLVFPSERTAPLWNHAFDPRVPMLVVTALFGLATLFVLWRSRECLKGRRGVALGMGLALVAGLIGAPKGTYWNQVMVLVPVGLLLAVEAPDLNLRRLPKLDLALLFLWLAGTWIQTWYWLQPPAKVGNLSAVTSILTSSSIYGLLCLWLLFSRRLLAARPGGPTPAAR